AWLSALSLDTRLEQSRAALTRLRARTAAIAKQRSEAELRLRIARRGLRIAQHRLAMRVRALYEEDETDPVTVLLGARSIGDAIERLDSLDRVAVQDEHYVEVTKAARKKLLALTAVLAGREAAAKQAEDAAAVTAAALETALKERRALIANLQAQQRENSAQASSFDSAARTLAAAQQAAAASVSVAAPVAGVRALSVTATGYSLQGRTATGVSVGWGVVAVDPSLIPLGTRMSIPGYGEGIAADTGGSVVGARIDLWFPTEAEALAWGTRSVTITLR
ncbi:MAG TPA: 3D domain-containing protein, partial [Gaiellaceae bacterium]|nr:3D domain-containing protein [Gaiellaceae bacterium]